MEPSNFKPGGTKLSAYGLCVLALVMLAFQPPVGPLSSSPGNGFTGSQFFAQVTADDQEPVHSDLDAPSSPQEPEEGDAGQAHKEEPLILCACLSIESLDLFDAVVVRTPRHRHTDIG